MSTQQLSLWFVVVFAQLTLPTATRHHVDGEDYIRFMHANHAMQVTSCGSPCYVERSNTSLKFWDMLWFSIIAIL
jgi:hypothetical protein